MAGARDLSLTKLHPVPSSVCVSVSFGRLPMAFVCYLSTDHSTPTSRSHRPTLPPLPWHPLPTPSRVGGGRAEPGGI